MNVKKQRLIHSSVIAASFLFMLIVSVFAGTFTVSSETKTITVTATYAPAVSSETQTVEFYEDTTVAATDSGALADGGSVVFDCEVDNTTPTLNLKSSSKVSISSIVVKDSNNTDITDSAFGAARYKTDFIESCKTSLFGYVELQDITGNITVEVEYGEPIADKNMGYYSSARPYFSTTVVTKGDVGPYHKAYRNDYNYQDLGISGYGTYTVGANAPTTSISGNYFSNKYNMRDGGQITSYNQNSCSVGFDKSNYSYISDIKMYYNDTGDLVETQPDLAGKEFSYNQKSHTYNAGSAGRSVTYVVTYKKLPMTTVYTRMYWNYKPSGYKSYVIADQGARFTTGYGASFSSSNTLTNLTCDTTNSSWNPIGQTSSGYDNGKYAVLDSDSVKYYFSSESINSGEYKNLKVYALDVANNRQGELIAGEGCEDPKLTLSYPTRDSWDDDGYVIISGLKAYGGDIYVTAEPYMYNSAMQLRQSGNHTKSFTITAGNLGAISGAGQTGDDANMQSSYTKSADEATTNHWMYAGGTYTVSSEDEINNLTLYYYKRNSTGTGGTWTTVTLGTNSSNGRNDDGSITFTLPSDFYRLNNSDQYIQVNFTPITTYEAQIYPTANGVRIKNAYSISGSGNSNNLVQVSTFENGEQAARIFNTASGVTRAYSSLSFNSTTSNDGNNGSKIYNITPGATVKVKDVWQAERRNVSETLPEKLKKFVNDRLVFKGIKVYEASNFTHNDNTNNASNDGTATIGSEIPCTREGDYYVFTMPLNSGVRIVPEYEHNVRYVGIFSNQRNGSNTYTINSDSSLGTASLTGDENNWFINPRWNKFDSTYASTTYAGHEWSASRTLTLDGSEFTLSATPKNPANYEVKSVKAYKYGRVYDGGDQNNYIWTSNLSNDSYNWLTYSGNNITNTEITGVVGTLSAPDESGTQTCSIKLPDDLDVGNIVLRVEFGPVTKFANFQYVNDSNAGAFNPPVTIKGIFRNSDITSVSATNGANVEAAVYDNDDTHILNMEIGGDNTKSSAIYNRNLIYSIKDSTGTTTHAQFRIYNNNIYPVDCTSEALNNYIDTAHVTFEASGNNGVCRKVVLPFKNTEDGLMLCHTDTISYAPVVIKQHVKDSSGETIETPSSFTAEVTKYFSASDANYFTAQDPFTATSFAESYTASGATDTHYMKLENSSSAQGLDVRAVAPNNYVLSSTPTLKTISPDNTVNTAAGVTLSDIGDNTYRVSFTGDNSGLSYMGGETIEIDITYEETDLTFAPFSYTATGSFRPYTVFSGTIAANPTGTTEGTNNLNTIHTAVYSSENPQYLTMRVGGDSTSNRISIFHEANLVYTLTDRNTNTPVLKFRIYHGQVEPVENYSQATFDQYIHSATVNGYNTSSNSGLMETATIMLKIPVGGLSMTGSAEYPYLPVTVEQYVLDNNGNETAAGASFTTEVKKYYTGSNDYGVHKYFNKNTITDTYGLYLQSEDDFDDTYTVSGASDTHYMIYLNATQGMYLVPSAPEGYDFALIEATALNSSDDEVNSAHKQNLTSVPNYVNGNGYQITFNSGNYLRGASIKVKVYYRPATNITIKQEMDGTLHQTNLLSKVTVTNTGTVAAPFKSYTNDADKNMADSVTLNSYRSDFSADQEHEGSLFRTTKLGVHNGVVPQITIEPQGARNVSSVKILKKNGSGEYVEVPSSAYTVTGTGATGTYITYTFTNASAIAFGDDYLVEVVYGRQQNLTVKAAIRNSNGSISDVNTAELYNQSGLNKITVSGQRYNISGADTTDKAFSNVNDTSDVFNSFEVTDTPQTVNSDTNTRVNIATTFNENSEYVIANIVAYNNAGTNLNLVVAGTKTVGEGSNQRTETTYENSTLPSLSSSDNVIVKVILAKVAKVKVSVFNILDNGTVADGTPTGLSRTNAYVNVSVRSNSINRKAIITSREEGSYYTGDFDVTYDPNSRTVSVIEGSSLDVFAQLPGNGQYVISKIVSDESGYKNIAINGVSRSGDNLRETLNTNNTVIASDKEYELEIYIQKARSIYTRVVKDQGNGTEAAGGGTVTMHGAHDTSGMLPFTMLYPLGGSTNPNQYNALTSGNDYTTEAKAIRDTKISFDVTPPSQYGIKSVSVKRGTTRQNATDISFSASAPNSNGMVTYTVGDKMSPNDDLFIDVTYAILQGGTITVDYQYTDDFVHYYNLFDSDSQKGISSMTARVAWSDYGTPTQVAKNLVTNEEKFSWTGIQYSESDISEVGGYKFEVATGNHFEVSASAITNGKWYVGVEGQCGIYNTNGTRISDIHIGSASSNSNSNCSIGYTMTTGKNVVFKVVLAPVSTVGSVAVERNSYGDPANARKENSGSAIINATKPNVNDPIAISHPIYSGDWKNSSGAGMIVKGSTITSVDVYKNTVDPGTIRSVILYEFDKNIIDDSGSNTTYQNLKNPIANNLYSHEWELTRSGTNDNYYHYILSTPVQVDSDKSYRVVVMYDRIKVINETTRYDDTTRTYVKPYLYYGSDNPEDLYVPDWTSGIYEQLSWNSTKYYTDNTINKKTAVYYVLVADLPKEELSLESASFEDYVDDKSRVSIKDDMLQTYDTRIHNGITKYYYYYKINPSDTYPIDNSVEFYVKFKLRTDNPPTPGEQSQDCDVVVEQWNRDTYDGNYVAAANQTVTFSVASDKVLKEINSAGAPRNPYSITTSTGSFYTNLKTQLTIKPIPETGYNVERVQITDGSTNNYSLNQDGEVKTTLHYSNVTIKIYYSRPLIRISSTNEGNKGKAIVDVHNTTTDETNNILDENYFTNGTFVTKGDNAEVLIRPLTYEDEGNDYYYTVASIRIGDAYNDTTTIYTATNGDVPNDGYTVEKMDDGSQYRLTLDSVQKDKYIFIQLVGKEKIYTSNLQVNQKIKLAGSNNYVDCSDGNYGSVTVNGILSGNNTPMNFDGIDLNTITFNDKAQIEGTAVEGTTLSLSNIVPPTDYVVDSIEVEMNGYPAGVTESNGTYTLNTPAPNSGSTVITVKYGLRRTEFTLDYKYYSREWNADNESNYENNGKVIGNNTQPDKSYKVKVNLADADIKDGKPLKRVLVNNAPSIDDLYKDCKWKFDDNHVTYSGNTVTITPDQPAKTFTVKFFRNNGSADEFETITKVKLNNLVKKDGEFIEADEKSGNSDFAYWLVKKAGTDKEITKCYSREFNLRVTTDIDVVAYYGEKAKSITLSDPIFSREQTNDGNGNVSDKLFADFILGYMEDNGKLFNSSVAASEGVENLEGYSSGLIVEFDSAIKLDREDEKGHKLTDQEKVVFPVDDAVNKDTIISYIKGENPSLPTTRALINLPVNNNSYNNKNRVNKVLDFNNTENARHTVLRAYYYVKDESGNVQLTDPVYFYLYDIGNAESVIEN